MRGLQSESCVWSTYITFKTRNKTSNTSSGSDYIISHQSGWSSQEQQLWERKWYTWTLHISIPQQSWWIFSEVGRSSHINIISLRKIIFHQRRSIWFKLLDFALPWGLAELKKASISAAIITKHKTCYSVGEMNMKISCWWMFFMFFWRRILK